MGRGTLGEVRDGSVDPRGGPRRVWGPFRRSVTSRGTLGVDQDGSTEPWGGPDKGWETLGEVRDGSEDPRVGPRSQAIWYPRKYGTPVPNFLGNMEPH